MRETAQTLQNRLDSSQKVEAFGNGFLQGSGLAHFAAQNFSARKGKLYIGRSGFAYKVGFSANPSARAKELGLSIIVAVPAPVENARLPHTTLTSAARFAEGLSACG